MEVHPFCRSTVKLSPPVSKLPSHTLRHILIIWTGASTAMRDTSFSVLPDYVCSKSLLSSYTFWPESAPNHFISSSDGSFSGTQKSKFLAPFPKRIVTSRIAAPRWNRRLYKANEPLCNGRNNVDRRLWKDLPCGPVRRKYYAGHMSIKSCQALSVHPYRKLFLFSSGGPYCCHNAPTVFLQAVRESWPHIPSSSPIRYKMKKYPAGYIYSILKHTSRPPCLYK